MVALVVWIALWYRKTAPTAEIKPLQRKRFYAMLGVGMLAGAAACGLVRAMLLTGVPRNIDQCRQVPRRLQRYFPGRGVLGTARVFTSSDSPPDTT